MHIYYSYSVMILYHRGVSLSEQHTDLLICYCTKQDLSHISIDVLDDKSSPEILLARYRYMYMPTAIRQLYSHAVWLHMHKLSFTLKS